MALQFEVNLSILFTELPRLERPAAAAAVGFRAADGPSAESFGWLPGTSVPASRGGTH